MTLHDACTSATSRILTVASLQRLAMEALIPAPVDCEVRSMIRFLNAKTIASCTRSMDTQASRSTHILQEFSRDVLNHDPPYSPDLVPSDFHLFLQLRKFLSGQRQRFQNDRPRWVSQVADFYDAGYKSWSHCMTNVSIPEMNMLKNSSTLAISVLINRPIKLGLFL